MSFSKLAPVVPARKTKSQARWELSKQQGTLLREIEDQAARLSEELNVRAQKKSFLDHFSIKF